MKKKTNKALFWILGIFLLIIIGVAIYFSVIQSLVGNSVTCDYYPLTIISETQEGVNFQMSSGGGCYGGNMGDWDGKKTFSFYFESISYKDTLTPYIKIVNGTFPLSLNEYKTTDAQVTAEFRRNYYDSGTGECWGSANPLESQTSNGNATCIVVDDGMPQGNVISPRESYRRVKMKCQIDVPFGDENYPCKFRSWADQVNGFTLKIFIPKIGYEKEIVYNLQDNKCIEKEIYSRDKMISDYSTLQECQDNIKQPKSFNWILWGSLAFVGIFIILITTFILRRKR